MPSSVLQVVHKCTPSFSGPEEMNSLIQTELEMTEYSCSMSTQRIKHRSHFRVCCALNRQVSMYYEPTLISRDR